MQKALSSALKSSDAEPAGGHTALKHSWPWTPRRIKMKRLFFRHWFALFGPAAGPVVVSKKLFHLFGCDHLTGFGQGLTVETLGYPIVCGAQSFADVEALRGIGHAGGMAPHVSIFPGKRS